MGPQAILGGHLNSSVLSLDDVFKVDRGIHFCYESDHLHGDVAIARGLQAASRPCEVRSTSKAHKMVVVMATVRSAKVLLTPRWAAREKPESHRCADKAAPNHSADESDSNHSADKPASNHSADESDSNLIMEATLCQPDQPPCVPEPGSASALAGVRCGSPEGNFSTCQRRGCASFGTGARWGFLNSSCIFLSHKGCHCGEGANHDCCCYTCALRETPNFDATVQAHPDFLRHLRDARLEMQEFKEPEVEHAR